MVIYFTDAQCKYISLPVVVGSEEMDQASNLNAQLFCMMAGMKMNLSTEIRTILKLCDSKTTVRSSIVYAMEDINNNLTMEFGGER